MRPTPPRWPGGRIRVEDVQVALAATSTGDAQHGRGGPPSGMRRTIARRMTESRRDSAQFTMSTTADVTDLVGYREQLTRPPTFTDFVARACALALREHPNIHVTFVDDRIVPADGIHIGMAVSVDGGLVVPVIRDADTLGLAEFAARSTELVRGAREGTLTMDELTGSTFSVTSLGGQGIDAFTPILNPPESATLGVGRIRDHPARFADQVVWRREMILSLTVYHRAIDGHPGAEFLGAVVEKLAQPHTLA